ncbi:tryptophan 2,3-dioxygenase family protein [Kitasatospora sp. NBC_01250]|uniref:tryptophan 2,3-dioxygenase n=1 Tax=unclassified Kitasatospora TaxID=2633591 RepID=UPI002E11A7FD|nr:MULTISPECIES: tryptophan 2,3-dioxygenase family protein [unclassified Kitasatospora]WSJ69732.1 tryptophan 2,3-dioxygenase family protein [Kitasatospora sp. NBC_01302]
MAPSTVQTPNLAFDPTREGAVADLRTSGATPYERYARLDVLHTLQQPRSTVDAELSFIITTQVMELLFDLLKHEWTLTQQALRADDLPGAVAALRRGAHVQDVLNSSWDLLATLTPVEFSAFRPVLGEASGFQSSAYLRLEFTLGNKSERLLEMYQGSPEVHRELSEALTGPSLYDDVLALLARRGLTGEPTVSSERYRADEAVQAAWHTVYTDPGQAELVVLAEALLDTAERVSRWRQRHYASVKRSMGAKPGTGGSSGLSWLKAAADQDVFPELWNVRGEL